MIKTLLKRKKPNRSKSGDLMVGMLLFGVGCFMALPLVYAICNAFKPLDEIFLFPPTFFVMNPTFENFHDLFLLMAKSWIPFSRYIFNTFFITIVGTIGNVFICSLAAYVLAKHTFPGSKWLFQVIVLSLMFSSHVTSIPNYLIMSKLGWVDTYNAIIIPAFATPLGLFLMKQFMEQVNDSLLEAARIDGAGEGYIFFRIAMPLVKPAWLTLSIFSLQGLWNISSSNFIYKEELKTLPYALRQVAQGGIARAGVSAAIALLMMIVPITFFMITQSNIIETMGSSGIKE